jgi:hypothetical protein
MSMSVKPKATSPPDYDALQDALLKQLGGPVEVETPQLGRVTFPRPAELYAAMNYLRMAQAQAAGLPTTGVFTVGYCRGLGPSRGEGL